MKHANMIRQILKATRRVGAIVSKTTLTICGILLVFVTIEILLGVFFRYVVRNPISWSEEAARYILVWMAMLGASVTTERREHLRLDTIVEKLPLVMQKILDILLGIVVVVILSLIMPWVWDMLTGSARTNLSPAMQIPMAIPLSSLAVGLILLIFQTSIAVVTNLLSLFVRESPLDDAGPRQ